MERLSLQVYLGEERGYGFKVFADETRPHVAGCTPDGLRIAEGGLWMLP